MPPTTPNAPPSVGQRILVGTLLFGLGAPAMMFVIALAVSLSYPGRTGEAAGWTGMALGLIGVPVGAVTGLLISALGPGETWWRRCVVTILVFAVAALIMAVTSIKR